MSVSFCIVFLPLQRESSLRRQLLVVLGITALLPASASAVGIMVNEYRVVSGGPSSNKMANTEFIEFVLTEDATAADLAGLTFGSTTHQTNTIISVFQFDQTTLDGILTGSGRSTFAAGSVIVVKGTGLGAQNLTYDPQIANIGNADAWSIELVAGQGAMDHSETVIDGVLDMDRRGTVVWVSTDNPPSNNIDTSGFIAAIGHDDNPGTIANAVISQFGAGNILNATFGAGSRTVQNTGADTVSLAASTTSTMGAANGAANQTWIENSLRAFAVPEPSRALLSLLAMTLTLCRRRVRRN